MADAFSFLSFRRGKGEDERRGEGFWGKVSQRGLGTDLLRRRGLALVLEAWREGDGNGKISRRFGAILFHKNTWSLEF